MEFWVTIAGLVRRRRVIIPALLVAVALGAAVYVTTPVTYTSSTTMILTTTEYGGTESQDPAMPSDLINPMLNFNDSLRTTSAILIEAMNTKEVATQLGALGRTTLRVDDGRTQPEPPRPQRAVPLHRRREHVARPKPSGSCREAQALMREQAAGLAECAEGPGEDVRQPRRRRAAEHARSPIVRGRRSSA